MTDRIHHVLIVEDDDSHAFFMEHCFKDRDDIQLHRAIDGEDALIYFPEAPTDIEQIIPELVFLDLRMPKMDGLAVLRYVRKNPIYDKIPIIITTSSEAPSDIQQATEAGANEYVTKPFGFKNLKIKMNQLCTDWLK